jgi:2-polyprenyl-3-methyl-5-hydroxy-6-metoxy-1,4-benzoquinol methylase
MREHKETVAWTTRQITEFWEFEHDISTNDFSLSTARTIARRAARYIRNTRVLDYGCGGGHLIPHLLRYASAAWGCDITPNVLATANAAFSHLPGFRGASTPQALLDSGERFDAIFLVEVLEHLNDKFLAETFGNVMRLLKERGFLIITTPNAEILAANYIYCPHCASVFNRTQHVRSWTAETLRTFLLSHGLDVLETRETDLRDLWYLRRIYAWYQGNRRHPRLYCAARRNGH